MVVRWRRWSLQGTSLLASNFRNRSLTIELLVIGILIELAVHHLNDGVPPSSPRLLDKISTVFNGRRTCWRFRQQNPIAIDHMHDEFGIVTYLVTGPARLPAMVANWIQ